MGGYYLKCIMKTEPLRKETSFIIVMLYIHVLTMYMAYTSMNSVMETTAMGILFSGSGIFGLAIGIRILERKRKTYIQIKPDIESDHHYYLNYFLLESDRIGRLLKNITQYSFDRWVLRPISDEDYDAKLDYAIEVAFNKVPKPSLWSMFFAKVSKPFHILPELP